MEEKNVWEPYLYWNKMDNKYFDTLRKVLCAFLEKLGRDHSVSWGQLPLVPGVGPPDGTHMQAENGYHFC